MNVRLEEQNARFKISEEELKQLIGGGILNIKLGFSGNDMIIMIHPDGSGEDMEAKQVFDGDTTYLTLLVPKHRLEELNNMGKNRAGIEAKQKDLSISLQVDVRKDTRPREKA